MGALAAWMSHHLLVGKLALSILMTFQVGMGTVFWSHGDPQNPDNRNACHLKVKHVPKRLDDNAMAFAHKTLPCGQWALIVNPRTGKSVYAQKVDWGPKRGLIDVTRGVSRAIGHNGMEQLIVIPVTSRRKLLTF